MRSNNVSLLADQTPLEKLALSSWDHSSVEQNSPRELLHLDQEIFQLLFDASPVPLWIYDRKTLAILAVNNAAVRSYLYSREEFGTVTVNHICRKPLRTGEDTSKSAPGIPCPQRHRRKDGTTFVALVTQHPIVWNGSNACLVLAEDTCATDQHRKISRETEQRYRELFDHSHDIVFTADLTGRLTSLNRTGEKVLGCSLEEVLRGNMSQLLFPHSLETALCNGERFVPDSFENSYRVEIVRKDGKSVLLAVQTALTYCNGKLSGVRGTARDITEHVLLEAKMRQSQKMEALGLLAGGIAHDFNNLLAVMMGYSEILCDRLDSDKPLHRFASEILKAGQQAASLTTQLLAFSRRQVLQPRVLNLNSIIENMEGLLRRLIREDIDVFFVPDPALGHVKADPGQLQQVILNLAANARDAMPQGGDLKIRTENVTIEDGCFQHEIAIPAGRYVLLTVSDTGMGMDAKTKASIFEPFFTTKRFGKGTGLGLATVYGIVKQSGGSISVQSEVGKGSSFMIYLPRVEEQVAQVISTNGSVEATSGTETILLVDDAEPFRKLVRMILESAGYRVLEAQTCSEAAQLGATHDGPIDLLLTDVIMPKIDGYQLSDFLRFHRPSMTILYMSGYTNPDPRGSAAPKPGCRILQKPFRKDALLFAVRQVLDERARLCTSSLPGNSGTSGLHQHRN